MELEWLVLDQDNVQQATGRGCAAATCLLLINGKVATVTVKRREEIKISYTAALLLADGVWICMEVCIDPRSGTRAGHEACPHRRRHAFWQ
jgi:hypothetical protein